MNTISAIELKNKLDNKESFILLMCMGDEAFRAKHIPGSICFNINSNEDCNFAPDDEIIVYCSGADCVFSKNAYNILQSKGYKKLYHYPGGLADWENEGYETVGNS